MQLHERHVEPLLIVAPREYAQHVTSVAGAHAQNARPARVPIDRRGNVPLHDTQPPRQTRTGIVVLAVPLLVVAQPHTRHSRQLSNSRRRMATISASPSPRSRSLRMYSRAARAAARPDRVASPA